MTACIWMLVMRDGSGGIPLALQKLQHWQDHCDACYKLATTIMMCVETKSKVWMVSAAVPFQFPRRVETVSFVRSDGYYVPFQFAVRIFVALFL